MVVLGPGKSLAAQMKDLTMAPTCALSLCYQPVRVMIAKSALPTPNTTELIADTSQSYQHEFSLSCKELGAHYSRDPRALDIRFNDLLHSIFQKTERQPSFFTSYRVNDNAQNHFGNTYVSRS